jgi:hypothetical protein
MDHLQDVNSSKMVVCRGVVAPQMSDNLTDSNGVVCVCASACGGWLGGRVFAEVERHPFDDCARQNLEGACSCRHVARVVTITRRCSRPSAGT